jgi:hypothetical protein
MALGQGNHQRASSDNHRNSFLSGGGPVVVFPLCEKKQQLGQGLFSGRDEKMSGGHAIGREDAVQNTRKEENP